MLRTTLRLLYNLLILPLWPVWWLVRYIGRPQGDWVVVRLRPRLVELKRPDHWWQRWLPWHMPGRTSSMHTLREVLSRIKNDSARKGVAIVLPQLSAGWAVCAGLRDALLEVRDAGKEVVVMLSQGGGNRELFIASAAGRVWMTPHASLSPLGLSTSGTYLKTLLDRTGVQVESFARKEYKSAAERLTRDSMSEPQREQLQRILDGHQAELTAAIADRVGPERAQAVFEAGFLRGPAAIELGLVDALGYEDELPALLSTVGEDEQSPRLIEAGRYAAYVLATWFVQVRKPPRVAVISVRGAIGESGGLGGRRESVVWALRKARRDRRTLGVVLWIDSPGGSADASDLIHREVVRLREKKPVVACFGDIAASGGYYIAAPCNAIVAQKLTLTGSIGVVSARFVVRDLLKRVGVGISTLKTAPYADLFSPHRPLSEDERALLDRELDAFYETFVKIVAAGRKRTVEEIEPLARGRVWLGLDAYKHGLVDRLGGFEAALDELRTLLHFSPERWKRVPLHSLRPTGFEHPSPPEAVAELTQAWAPLLSLARQRRVLYHAPNLPRIR